MPHLIAENVGGGIHFCHHGSVGVAQVVVFEHDVILAFEFPRGVFHGVHRLDFSIWQTVHKLRGRDLLAVQVLYDTLVLLSQGGVLEHILFPPLGQLLKIHFQFIAHVDGALGVAGFQRHQLDKTVLVLHLPINQDRSVDYIDI